MTRLVPLVLVLLAFLVTGAPRAASLHDGGDHLVASHASHRDSFPDEGLLDLSEIEEVQAVEDLELEEDEEFEARASASLTRHRRCLVARADHRPRDGQLLRTLCAARGPPVRA